MDIFQFYHRLCIQHEYNCHFKYQVMSVKESLSQKQTQVYHKPTGLGWMGMGVGGGHVTFFFFV